MITDQKTQNRLHADTGTELFSIRQRKEAVTRMLDILKETPEYLQVMNHIPAYAMDDDTSEWWKSEESENFMNSLLEVISWRGIRHGQNRLYITGHVSCKRKNTPVRASDGNKRLL